MLFVIVLLLFLFLFCFVLLCFCFYFCFSNLLCRINLHLNDIIAVEQNIKDISEKKTASALLRSKGKWYEEGEQSSKYFFPIRKIYR